MPHDVGTAKLTPPCEERRVLALRVAAAVAKVSEAGKKYEAAKSRKTRNAGEFYDALLQARQVERDALHALRDHIEQHECAA